MKIGVAGLMSLDLINIDYKGKTVPKGYKFPLISNLINGILKKGHEVVAYTTSEDISEPLVFTDRNITVCVARRESHPGRDLFKSEREDLVYLMKKYPADVISAQWSYEFAWAALDSGIPTLVTLRDHATTILKFQPDAFRFARWIMNLIVLRKAKHLTTNSEYLLKLLSKKNQSKAVVINNFFKSGLENYFDTGVKENYIVSVANGFGKRKNLENAIKAFQIVRKQFPGMELRLVGSEMEENGKAHAFAKENKLEEGIRFIGNLPYPEVINQIKNAQLLIHPSREESFGNTLLEGMVLGTPVIGGKNSGNVPYMLEHGKYGHICDVDDPEDIAKTINNLLSNKKESERLKWEAHQYALRTFSEDAVVDKYLEQLNKIYEESYSSTKERNLAI